MNTSFVHLHLHTEFSLVDGLIRIKPLFTRLRELGQPACAMTDQSNLFGMVKFYKAALQAGIKPIIGVDAWISAAKASEQPSRMVLLCQNEEGYRHLSVLLSRAYQENQHVGQAIIQREWLEGSTQGLLALSGGLEGEIGRALLNNKPAQAEAMCTYWARLFGDRFYLELTRTGHHKEEDYVQAALALASAHSLPVVASNNVRFLHHDDFDAHEARVCIHGGHTLDDPRRPKVYTAQQYLRASSDMQTLFSDLPEALENTLEIAKRCNLVISMGKSVLPDYPIPSGLSAEQYFRQQSQAGLLQRLERILDPTDANNYQSHRDTYTKRLEIELDVICQMGFPGYFLIVADFIQWAKDNGIPVGPGRGSGAGSLVAYALKITDLDPLRYELLFERFLNPERVSMPDFDIDFCMEGRDRVIDYVAKRYGREKVSQIITHGTMAAKAVVRDVGRVLGHAYGFVDRIAKLIPFEIGITLDKALAQEEELKRLYEQDEDVQTLIDLAKKLEGVARNAGKHAGGVVIAPSKLTDFSPLYCEEDGQSVVTQFDKDDVETIGLVKFDFLGLRTLTIINWAVQAINADLEQRRLPALRIDDIALDDAKAFALLKRQETTAVFQLESRGMKDLIKRLQPDNFEEIVALVALYRPGPLQSGMVDDFINRKHGRAKVEYPHPSLEPILKPTYGIILYQEQVMQIAQVLAGYSLGGADLLRRAMGKKKPEEMAKQREIFVSGALQNQVTESIASYIFDLMEKFAGYGFNKTLAASTLIYTTSGIKKIQDCSAGDQVLSMNHDGSLCVTTVQALHDHGLVSLWEVIFNDGIKERCTLDHKWLTHNGQRPLWQIMQQNESIWGVTCIEDIQSHDDIATAQSFFPARVVLRHPVSVQFKGWEQGYDLEVDHPQHNFLLASGLCCSNSHSAAYALVSYQTLWLKAHYPSAFMAAVLSADMDNTDKVVNLIEECRAMELAVVPPDINTSDYIFKAQDTKTIIYGLGAIKGVGEAAIDTLLHARNNAGHFRSLDDLCLRLASQKLTRRTLEALIRAGTLDTLGANRATLMASLTDVLSRADQHLRNTSMGQSDMFGITVDDTPTPALSQNPASDTKQTLHDWDDKTRLEGEKETLGLYLTGHPIDQYERDLRAITGKSIAEWIAEILDRVSPQQQGKSQENGHKGRRNNEHEVLIAGLIVNIRTRQGGRGRMGFATLDDRTARLEVALFGEEYARFKNLLQKDQVIIVEGMAGIDEFNGGVRVRARSVLDLDTALKQFTKKIMLRLKTPLVDGLLGNLHSVLKQHQNGSCEVLIRYENDIARADFKLGKTWGLEPNEALFHCLRSQLGKDAVSLLASRSVPDRNPK